MNHLRTRRLATLTMTLSVAALVVAACGSSSNTGSSASSSGSASSAAAGGSAVSRSKLAVCLKAHGVTPPARPAGARQRPTGGEGGGPGLFFGGGGGGGGGQGGGPGAGRLNNPKLRAAMQACGGGRFPQRGSAANRAAITKFVACVKQHGYNLPTPNFSGKGAIFPASIGRSKQFQAAARPCASDLRPSGAPAGGATSSA